MPFWVDIFHDYYLPDLLHAALLAALLLFLLSGYTSLAFLLLFPAYLARESTLLVALCLVFACWRRIRLRPALAGALAILAAGFISRHYNQEAAVSVHGISGGPYIVGKLIWSFFKNVLGLPLWSNTLPECSPIWMKAIPPGWHFGAIRSIGLCQPSLWGPTRLLLAWFGVFGIGPALALTLGRKLLSPSRELPPGGAMVFRFCLLYGLISILMTPLLGASADRLVEYGWPFYFVLLPWFLSKSYDLRGLRSCWADSAPLADLLAGLVCLPSAASQLLAGRPGCPLSERPGVRRAQAVFAGRDGVLPTGNLAFYPHCG